MARVFDTSAERGRIREDAIKTATKRVSERNVTIPSIMSFSGNTGSDGPLFKFLAPCRGFISNITFRGDEVVSSNILIKILRPDDSVFINQFKAEQLSSIEAGALSVSQNDMIEVSVDIGDDKESQDVSVAFIFNIQK